MESNGMFFSSVHRPKHKANNPQLTDKPKSKERRQRTERTELAGGTCGKEGGGTTTDAEVGRGGTTKPTARAARKRSERLTFPKPNSNE
jgi:hypothetical protein